MSSLFSEKRRKVGCAVTQQLVAESHNDMKELFDISILFEGYPFWCKILALVWIANSLVLLGARLFISPSVPQEQVAQRDEPHQQMNSSPGALQIGNVVGSMTVNQMHAGEPETLARLRSEVHRLLRFPDAILDKSTPPSLLEGMLANRLPYRLFQVLMTYDEQDVVHAPEGGEALRAFLNDYYQFRQRILKLEATVTDRIGQMVAVRFREAWKIYLRYLILRFDGQSKDQIIAAGTFLNFDITWDDAERVYAELAADASISTAFSELFATHKKLVEQIAEINELFSAPPRLTPPS